MTVIRCGGPCLPPCVAVAWYPIKSPSLVLLCLSLIILEVTVDIRVDCLQVLLATDPETTVWLVLLDILRPKAMDWGCCKPTACQLLSHFLVLLPGVRIIVRVVFESKQWNNVLQCEGVDEHMKEPGTQLRLNQSSTLDAVTIALAICLHYHATQHCCHTWCKHPLRPPIDVHTCIATSWDCRNDTPVVKSVNNNVREDHGIEQRVSVSTWEKEDDNTK